MPSMYFYIPQVRGIKKNILIAKGLKVSQLIFSSLTPLHVDIEWIREKV